MKILALDTATEACSAALNIDGEISSQYQLAPREHSRLILKMIDGLLSRAGLSVSQLDAVAFGRGPGSFMGLRIAAGVTQGIAFAHELPVVPVSCLKSIAQLAYRESGCRRVLTAIDARMDEVYWANYRLESGQWQLDGDECVISPDMVPLPEQQKENGDIWTGAGTGWGSYKDRLLQTANFKLQTILPQCFPSAEVIAELAVAEFDSGNVVTAAEAIPVYLRNNVAKKPKPVVF